MKTSFVFRRAIQALLPATLLLAACSKSDTPTPTPTVDQGSVLFINAASNLAPTTLKFAVDNADKASLAYGVRSDYQLFTTGSRSVLVTAGTQSVVGPQAITVEKGKNYTFLATPTSSLTSAGGLLLSDDLTAPATGKARIRVVNLVQNVATNIRLSQITTTANGPVVVDLVTNVAPGGASSFVDFTPSTYALSILDTPGTSVAEIGDGSGTGTGTKAYEAGKIYTVVVGGTKGSIPDPQKPKAFLFQNN
ncbi:MAG: hypothetical protein JWP58_2906 [Hymenobacter sp.]|nr:hypothetical protein [Hymenobacter sp.]